MDKNTINKNQKKIKTLVELDLFAQCWTESVTSDSGTIHVAAETPRCSHVFKYAECTYNVKLWSERSFNVPQYVCIGVQGAKAAVPSERISLAGNGTRTHNKTLTYVHMEALPPRFSIIHAGSLINEICKLLLCTCRRQMFLSPVVQHKQLHGDWVTRWTTQGLKKTTVMYSSTALVCPPCECL